MLIITTVEYTDPSHLYGTIAQDLSRRLPLKNLHWNSSSRPLRSIKSLHVDLVPDEKRSSQPVPLHESLGWSDAGQSGQNIAEPPRAGDRPSISAADSFAKKERRHQIPGLRQTPYLKIYLLRCEDVDKYKASARKLVREWVKDHTPAFQKSSKYNTQENHDAFEWLILHVVSTKDATKENAGLGDNKGESRWSKRSSSNLIDKIRTDFNGTSKSAVDRVAQVYVSGDAVGQSSDDGDTGWGDLIFKLKSLILASFDLRVRQYEEDIREKESQRSLPGWNFNTFFVLKEGLAMGFESVGLIEDALTNYHELAAGLHGILEGKYADATSTTSAAQFQDYTDDLLMEVKKAAASALGATTSPNGKRGRSSGLDQDSEVGEDLGRDILKTDRKPFRELILANRISAFDFQCYIFARQAALLLRLGNASSSSSEISGDGLESQRSSDRRLSETSAKEPWNLLILADVCQRAVEFIVSACRTMRNELSGLLKQSVDEKTEGSIIQFPSQELVVENLIASWTYSVADSVLWRTSAQSLATQLQPLIRQLKPQRKSNSSTKDASSREFPRRTSSLSPSTSAPQRPPSPEKFPSVTSLDAMRLLPPNPSQTGAQDLAAERAALHTLQRQALSHVGLSYGGWKSGWPDMHLDNPKEDTPFEEVSLDEPPSHTNGTSSHKQPRRRSLNGIRNQKLREALFSDESFYVAYEDLTASTLALDVFGERKKTAEALTADLAAVRFKMEDYAAAASYFRQLAPFYAQGQWRDLEIIMLDLYAQCLDRLDRIEEYVSIVLKIISKQIEALSRLQDSTKLTSNQSFSGGSETYLQRLLTASKRLERPIIAPLERFFDSVSLDPNVKHSKESDSFHLLLSVKPLFRDSIVLDEARVSLVRMAGEQRTELWLSANDFMLAARGTTKISLVSMVRYHQISGNV